MGYPLEGVRVVALEQAVAAPFCTRHLADLGADVVKIERPDGGDFGRRYDTVVNGMSSYFVWLNRGKRSLTLDLKSEGGRELLTRLLDRRRRLHPEPRAGRRRAARAWRPRRSASSTRA